MTVITRFAPSPTGDLHIGGARTALFNWLFARHHGGKFLLRIEDTDRERSTDAAFQAILNGMSWLGLEHDGDYTSQFESKDRHAEVAKQILEQGKGYKCFCTKGELTKMREDAKAKGEKMGYDGTWRDRDPADAPADAEYVIRIKSPQADSTTVSDLVQGDVTVENTQLDDFILLRSDGTPTYMLAVVVDDHDMGVTHIIRGDDHLNNVFRQKVIYDAMGWDIPEMVHVPLIHGADGGKLSKRHGAQSVEEYRDMGYLPEALCNYLLRLGWGHGDDEIISTAQAIEWFGTDGMNKAPSRFDFDKLGALNAHYIKEMDNKDLTQAIMPYLVKALGTEPSSQAVTWIEQGMDDLKTRAQKLDELANEALFYARPRPLNEKATNILNDDARSVLAQLKTKLECVNDNDFTADNIDAAVKDFVNESGLKFGKVGMPLRAALTGTGSSPSITHIAAILGRDETLARLSDVAS